jgi:hypothetical protein
VVGPLDDAEKHSMDEKKDRAQASIVEVKSTGEKVYSDKDPSMRKELEAVFKRSLIYSATLTSIVVIIGMRNPLVNQLIG